MLIEDPSPTSGWEIFWKVRAGWGSQQTLKTRGDGWVLGSVALTAEAPLPPNSSLPSSTRHVSWSLKQQNSPTRQGSPTGPIPALGVCYEVCPLAPQLRVSGCPHMPLPPHPQSLGAWEVWGYHISVPPPLVCVVTIHPQHKWAVCTPPNFLSRPSA